MNPTEGSTPLNANISRPVLHPPKRLGLIFLILGLLVLTGFITWKIISGQNYLVDNDFFTFWLGGRLTGQNLDVYDPAVWASGHTQYGAAWLENPIFCYPLPMAFLYIPLGWLPEHMAALVQTFLFQWLILAGVGIVLLSWPEKDRMAYLLPVILGIAIFRPSIATLTSGQFGPVLLCFLALTAWLWSKERWLVGGFLLPFTLLKPTIGLPVVGLIALWLFSCRRWKALVGMGMSVSLLASSAWIYDPDWIGGFLSVGSLKFGSSYAISPTVWGMAAQLCGNQETCSLPVSIASAGLLALVSAGVFIYLGKWMDSWTGFAAAIPVALLVTPYVWPYDHLLLLFPILYGMGLLAKRKTRFLLVSLIQILFSILSILLLVVASTLSHDVWSSLIPAASLVFLLIVLWTNNPSRKASRSVVG